MPEATCHGVLPWRAPVGQRRRIFSLRFHIQHGELRPYRERKGVRTRHDFPEWQQVRARCLSAVLALCLCHSKHHGTHPIELHSQLLCLCGSGTSRPRPWSSCWVRQRPTSRASRGTRQSNWRRLTSCIRRSQRRGSDAAERGTGWA